MSADFLTRAGFQYPTDNHPQRTITLTGKGQFNFNPSEVWLVGGNKILPSAAAILDIDAANVNDDAAGTNARSVIVYGLDADYNEIEEIVPLVGAGTANTVAAFLRVFRMDLYDCGATRYNAGQIDVAHPVAGLQGRIFSLGFGDSQGSTLGTHYTIPAGMIGYITKWNVSRPVFSNNQEIYLQCRKFDAALNNPPYVVIDSEGSVMSTGDRTMQTPIAVPEKYDLRMFGWSTANIQVHAMMQVVLTPMPDLVIAGPIFP